MGCSRTSLGRLVCGIAVGAMALTPMTVQADHHEMAGGNMSGGGMAMSAAPTQLSGTVQRYYVDRSGYVTAMDIQTAEGVRFVRFAPGMGQRLYTTYPVGGQATVWVSGGGDRWDVVGHGGTAPQGMGMMPYTVTDMQLLDSEPYIMMGAKQITRKGNLRRVIVNNMGEVVGMVLDNNLLVRVPREFRHIAPGYAGTERVAQLFRRAHVTVTGYPEAPRYGAMSTYGDRIIASALVINDRQVGAVGIPMMARPNLDVVVEGVNIGGTGTTAEEMRARGMGYEVYTPGAPGAMDPAMSAPGGTVR